MKFLKWLTYIFSCFFTACVQQNCGLKGRCREELIVNEGSTKYCLHDTPFLFVPDSSLYTNINCSSWQCGNIYLTWGGYKEWTTSPQDQDCRPSMPETENMQWQTWHQRDGYFLWTLPMGISWPHMTGLFLSLM